MSDRPHKGAGSALAQPDVAQTEPMQYYVARGKVKTGPFSLYQLQSAACGGTLHATDMVLPDGTNKWRAAQEIPGLFPAPSKANPITAPLAARPLLFISYRRGDSPDTVKLIHDRLTARLPRWEIFYDHDSIPLGENFPERLRAKVTAATAVLVVIGPKWLQILRERKSVPIDHVREEVRLALEADARVIPVLVGNAAMPANADLADFADIRPLLQNNGEWVRPDPDSNGDLERIVAFLKPFDTRVEVGAILDEKYTLSEEIGDGGMGVVYAAEQKRPVKRKVAVKLIKPGMDTKDILARFDAERQALAVMDHPNIAKVLDAGRSDGGRPYFVMEYVKGVPITQYCDEKKLPPQERLNLFIPVCNAVQHAHQKGILHRDLKPSNVLVEVVDGKPVPKVIDFGLAKAMGQTLTDKTLHTTAGTRVGTLEYSAPEQAAGSFDIDTRSDIYSLGILLYELLAGAPPFTRKELLRVGEEEMKRVIREDVPATPSKKLSSSGELPAIAAKRDLEPGKLTRLVQGELDWIVMKCLEKERGRRYKNANDIGDELQRFLADEPVQAGPPSAAYRAKKFLRRNKGPVIAAMLVVLALVGGVLVASLGFLAEWQAKQDLQKAIGREQAETKRALEAGEQARQAKEQAVKAADAEKLATKQALAAAEAEKKAKNIAVKAGTERDDAFRKLEQKYEKEKLELETDLETSKALIGRSSEKFLREILQLRMQLEPESWATFHTKSQLGGSLLLQHKYKDAGALIKEGYEGMRQREQTIPPQEKLRLTEALERLVQFYARTGTAAEAERWRKELAARKAAEKQPKK